MPEIETPTDAASAASKPTAVPIARRRASVLELRVRNHPGTLSHVAGMFARRGFNLEAIRCAPLAADPGVSRMLLLVAEEPRLDQVERQLRRLHDVLEISHRPELDHAIFADLEGSERG